MFENKNSALSQNMSNRNRSGSEQWFGSRFLYYSMWQYMCSSVSQYLYYSHVLSFKLLVAHTHYISFTEKLYLFHVHTSFITCVSDTCLEYMPRIRIWVRRCWHSAYWLALLALCILITSLANVLHTNYFPRQMCTLTFLYDTENI